MPDKEKMADDMVRSMALRLGYSESQLDALQKRIEGGEPLYQILRIEGTLLDERYTLALGQYKSGKLDRAEELFRWLCLMNGTSSAYWMGLGACLQGQERWGEARTAYALAVAWSPTDDLTALYYLGLCTYQLGDTEATKKALKTFIQRASFDAQYTRELVYRAATILASLEKGA